MLRTKRLVAVFSYQFALKKRLSSQELPVSGEALIASLWTLPTLQQTFEVLEDKAVELQPVVEPSKYYTNVSAPIMASLRAANLSKPSVSQNC